MGTPLEPHDFAVTFIWILICHWIMLRFWVVVVFPLMRVLCSCICCCSCCCCSRHAPEEHRPVGLAPSAGDDDARFRHAPPQAEPEPFAQQVDALADESA